MEDARKTICDQCKKQVPTSDIRYMLRGGDSVTAVCSECRATRNVAIKGVASKSVAPKSSVAGKTTTAQKEEPQKITLFCTRCKYKFKIDLSRGTKKICPYCGRMDRVEEYAVQSADTLVETS